MSPPVQDHALATGDRAFDRTAGFVVRRSRTRGVALLGEVWGILTVAWAARLVTQTTDPAVMFFVIGLFVALVVPETRNAHLVAEGLSDMRGTLLRIAVAFGVTSAAITLVDLGSQPAVLAVAAASLPAVVAGRCLTTAFWRRSLAALHPQRIVVLGQGDQARRVLLGLESKKGMGVEIVGTISEDPGASRDMPLLGGIDHLERLIGRGQVDGIVVADPERDDRLIDLLRSAMSDGIGVWVVPQLEQFPARSGDREHLLGLPLTKLAPPAHEGISWLIKVAMERSLALLALVALSPVMAVIALAIYLDSGRPILFRQARIGRAGETFTMLKFRTMHEHPDDHWATDTSQITRVGKVLRDLSLDELPQLFNIARGEMALVGPRPERPHFVEALQREQPRYGERHRLPGGLTGLSQVSGLRGDEAPIEARVSCDNYYIDNWSLEEDFKIVLRTISAVVKKG